MNKASELFTFENIRKFFAGYWYFQSECCMNRKCNNIS